MLGPLPGTQTSVAPIRLYVLQHGLELATWLTEPIDHVFYLAGQDPVYFFATYNSPTSFAIYWVSPKSGAQFYWVYTNSSGVNNNGVGPWHDETTGLYYAITSFGNFTPSPILQFYPDVDSGLAAISAFIDAQGDPYKQVGDSQSGGGPFSPYPPTYDPASSDDIDFPGDPGVSAVNTGFISLWSPTQQQMLDLSRYMWNVDITTIDFWKRLWADPMDIIYGLNIIPVDFRATGRTIIGGTEHVIVGLVDTKVDMDYLVSQWIEVDCGSLDVKEIWGAYLDYDPYTKLEIYLPYCGYHPLRIDDFMSGSISLKYKIDLLSGACVAIIKATKPNDDQNDLDSIVYQFMGNCATQVPVTASQFADAVRSTMSLAASIGSMVATGVGGAAAAASKNGLSTVGKAKLASSMIGEGAAAVENVMGIKPAIERSGALGGASGLLAVQTPYLILTRPRQAHPEEQSKYTGYPSFMTRELGQCIGWTIVKEIHLEDIPCTSEEMIEIDNLLKEGVIF